VAVGRAMAVCRHKRNGSTKRRGAEDGAASVVYVCLCGGVLPIETRRGAVRRLACPWGCLLGGKPPVVADKCSVLAWLGWSGVAWQAGKNWMLCWLACCLLGGLVSLFQPL
jgi:hypothetical protein